MILYAIEIFPDAYEKSTKNDFTNGGLPNPTSLIKYVVRQTMAEPENKMPMKDWGKSDPLEPINAFIFSDKFAYKKDLGGYIPMFKYKEISRSLSKKIKEREPTKIRKKWKIFKEHVCTIDDEAPSLIDSFDDQHLYFMENERTGEIKIGISVHPEIRKRQLENECGEKIKILKVLASEGRSMEKKLHSMFKDYKTHGEWFEPHSELLEYMNAID